MFAVWDHSPAFAILIVIREIETPDQNFFFSLIF
jgi:hypothetical protein